MGKRFDVNPCCQRT